MIKIFGFRILTKKEYAGITGSIELLSKTESLLNRNLNKIEGRKRCFIQKGRYCSHDLLPFDDALNLMIKNFRNDISNQIDPEIDIQIHPDGVTRDVRLTFEYLEVENKRR